jgi:Flp pilus assembly protein TadB
MRLGFEDDKAVMKSPNGEWTCLVIALAAIVVIFVCLAALVATPLLVVGTLAVAIVALLATWALGRRSVLCY